MIIPWKCLSHWSCCIENCNNIIFHYYWSHYNHWSFSVLFFSTSSKIHLNESQHVYLLQHTVTTKSSQRDTTTNLGKIYLNCSPLLKQNQWVTSCKTYNQSKTCVELPRATNRHQRQYFENGYFITWRKQDFKFSFGESTMENLKNCSNLLKNKHWVMNSNDHSVRKRTKSANKESDVEEILLGNYCMV